MSRVASRLLVGKLVARPFVQGLRKKKKRKNKKTPFPFLSPKFERKRKKKRKETIVSSRGEGKFSALLIHSKQVSRGRDALRGCTMDARLFFFFLGKKISSAVCATPYPLLLLLLSPLSSLEGGRGRKVRPKGGPFIFLLRRRTIVERRRASKTRAHLTSSFQSPLWEPISSIHLSPSGAIKDLQE